VERPTPPGRVAATGARVAPASGSTAAASPSEAAAPQPSDPSAASGAKPAAAVCGNGTKEAGEQCDDGNTRDGDGCSAKCRLEPMAIAPSALELERVSGNTDIHPSKQTRSAMIAAGVNSVTGVVRLCVDTAGAVTEVDLQDATGYAEYDRKLVAAVRDWRFHPFVIHGTAMAVCSTSEFVYAPK
jgi:TonB family protein